MDSSFLHSWITPLHDAATTLLAPSGSHDPLETALLDLRYLWKYVCRPVSMVTTSRLQIGLRPPRPVLVLTRDDQPLLLLWYRLGDSRGATQGCVWCSSSCTPHLLSCSSRLERLEKTWKCSERPADGARGHHQAGPPPVWLQFPVALRFHLHHQQHFHLYLVWFEYWCLDRNLLDYFDLTRWFIVRRRGSKGAQSNMDATEHNTSFKGLKAFYSIQKKIQKPNFVIIKSEKNYFSQKVWQNHRLSWMKSYFEVFGSYRQHD